MIINDIDLGAPSHPWAVPITGQETGDILAEGIEHIVWARGSLARTQTVTFSIKAWQGIGGSAANTPTAMRYLLKQVEEIASNRNLQPVYIQWTASADPGAVLNAADFHDGWYIINDFDPDYSANVVAGIVRCQMTVTQVAPQAPRRMAVSYMGGALSTNFSGAAKNLISLPLGGTTVEVANASVTRVSAEGTLNFAYPPSASPEPFTPSATLANYFKGGVRVYDTINTGSNPVPTSGGTYVNANWVEVKYTDHDFQGDCVVTNGLQLLLFQAGQSQIATCYLWNTALAVANWQQYGTLCAIVNAVTLQSYSLLRVGFDECALVVYLTSASNNEAFEHRYRLQAGRYEFRADIKGTVNSLNGVGTLELNFPASVKIAFDSTAAADSALDATPNPSNPTDYGYAGAFINSTTYPFIAGFLYQNKSNSAPPNSEGTGLIGLNDNATYGAGVQVTYGVYAIPYGVSGTYSTANLQSEAESGTLGTGWSNVVDALASGGHTAKVASGTLAGNDDKFQTAWSPASGLYDAWFRIKVTDSSVSSAELTIGVWDPTAGSFISSTTLNRNAMSTSYKWVQGVANFQFPAAHATQFRAVTALTLTTDWFVDEAILVPRQLGPLAGNGGGPRDLWQQFSYDRSTRVVRV